MKQKFSLAVSLAVILAMLLTSFALADDISNNLDTSVDSVAEVMPLVVGDADGTTNLYLIERNGDGKNGCNLIGSTVLTLSVASSDTSVATVSPASVSFTSCGALQGLTIHAVASGSANILIAQTTNTTTGTFNLAPAQFSVNVSAPSTNTAPTVDISGVNGGDSYPQGSVPAAMCEVTDAEDGDTSFPATLSAISGPYASDGIGEQTASCSYTDDGGLTAEASVTYGIVDLSAPAIGYTLNPTLADGSNGWYKSNVTLTWSVSDSESPNSLAKTGCVDQNVTADQTVTVYSCSATSAGGSAGPVSVSIKRDATVPTISGSASPAANGFGWNNGNVTVSFDCADGTSGVASCGPDATLTGEGAGQSVAGTAVDNAGNSAGTTVSGINIDKTAPTASATASPAPNAANWNNTAVTISFSGSDSLSGVNVCEADVVLSSEGAGQSASGTCTDKAGNVSTPATATANIDLTAPSVSLFGGPANGASYYFGSVPAAPTCSASDGLSGLNGACNVSGYATTVGTHTVTASASDKAGNSASASATYTVLAWTLNGFYQPVDMNGVWNTVKGGSTIPLKFNVYAGPLGQNEQIDVSAIQSFTVSPVSCVNGSEDAVEFLTTGGTSLRYDTTGHQFVQNWQTPRTIGCYRVTMTTKDLSTIIAYFKTK